MVGQKPGGVNVFGGGLALYATGKIIVGGVGVSGDTSCADHDIGWRVRHNLGLDHLAGVGGVSGDPNHPDNIIYDIVANSDGTGGTGQDPTGNGGVGKSPSGFGHPKCLNTADPTTLPKVQP
jgi:Haem-degrading